MVCFICRDSSKEDKEFIEYFKKVRPKGIMTRYYFGIKYKNYLGNETKPEIGEICTNCFDKTVLFWNKIRKGLILKENYNNALSIKEYNKLKNGKKRS